MRFGYEPIQAASMDETLDFILELQAFIHVVAMVPVVLAVLIAVSTDGWSVHPPSRRELVHNSIRILDRGAFKEV